MIWFLTARASSWSRSTLVEVGGLGPGRLDRIAELAGQEPEIIHLPEQVAFLLAGQQRDLVEAGQVRGEPFGGLGPAGGLAVGRFGHRAEDLVAGGRVFEAGVGYVLQLDLLDSQCPHLVEDPVDARPGPVELRGEVLGRDPPAVVVQPVDLRLGGLVEGVRAGREDRAVGVLEVVGLERHPDGFGRAVHFLGDPPGDLDQAGLADRGHPPGPADDLLAFLVGEPLELRAPVDLVAVRLDEPGQARLEEADLGPAGDREPAGDEPLASPPGDGPGRDVVASARLLDRQDRLGRLLDRLADRRREVFHQPPEVRPDAGPVEHLRRGQLGPEPGDPEQEVFVRISLLLLDLGQQLLGAVDLLEESLLRRVARLLLLELPQRRMAICNAHLVAPDSILGENAPFVIRPPTPLLSQRVTE